MRHKKKNLSILSGILGNILEHYDAALFGLLVPFMAPIFFGKENPLTSLTLTYGILCLGFIAKPLGALYFGWIGDRFGRRQALYQSLVGMAIMTVSIGCLPSYEQVGVLSPILLTMTRLLQNFCAAGETSGGAIFVLENTTQQKRTWMSSLYDASSIGGILLGSFLITLLSRWEMVEIGWRFLFWLGGLAGGVGVFLRMRTKETGKVEKRPFLSDLKSVYLERSALFKVIAATGFSYAIYGLVFTLMNGFVPLVTGFSKTEVMQLNTILLVLDMMLLPFFGWIGEKVGKEKVMLFGVLSAIITAFPVFYCLKSASLSVIFIARSLLVISGVAFAAPYYAWSLEIVPPHARYKILSLGSALGSQLIGFPTAIFSLLLYQKTGWIFAPAIYLLLVSSLALWALLPSYLLKENKRTI